MSKLAAPRSGHQPIGKPRCRTGRIRIRQDLRRRSRPSCLDTACRRSGNPGFRLHEIDRRSRGHVFAARIGRRRRRARPLFLHRYRPRHHLARIRRQSRNQPLARNRARQIHAGSQADTRKFARAAEGKRHRAARRLATERRRRHRLHGLRHRPPGRTPAARQSRPALRPGLHPGPSDCHGRVRQCQR